MKRVLLMVFSIILILACIFGLFACVAGVRDVLNINDYKHADAAFARENLETARAGIAQLKENEETYLTGVGTYTDGLSQYTKGLSDYAAGKATLAAGEKTLAEGYAAYEAGKKKLAEGQAIIDANTQAYNEGKEKLAKIEPLLPYLNQYVQFRDGTIAKLPGFDSAQAWFVGKVAPIAERLGLSIPADVTDFPAYVQNMVAEGKAMLKQYEVGLKELEAGKAELAAGEQQLAEAEKQLARNQGAARMAARRQLLETKQALVDAAFHQAEQQLLSLPEAEYTKLCAQLAARASTSGHEELIFCAEDRERVGQAVAEQANALLQKAGKPAGLTLSAETRPLRGGVVLKDGLIETNCSIGTMVSGLRPALSGKVAACLFG